MNNDQNSDPNYQQIIIHPIHPIILMNKANELFEKDYDMDLFNIVLECVTQDKMKELAAVRGYGHSLSEGKEMSDQISGEIATITYDIMDKLLVEKKRRMESYMKAAAIECEKDRGLGM